MRSAQGPFAPPPPDIRMVGRAVGGLLLATGAPMPADRARADAALARLGRPPLEERDLVLATPEELAPRIPASARPGLLALLYELAGDEPIRRRLADAYARLFSARTADEPPPSAVPPLRALKTPARALVRWLLGPLPRHHDRLWEVEMSHGPYRDANLNELPVAPSSRAPLRDRVERIAAECRDVLAAVEQVIVGKRSVIERVLGALAARGHVLLVDVPGTGKTQLVKAIGAALAVEFGRVQFTPDLLPADITGANLFDVRDHEFRFRPGPVFTHLLLADEINRATPKTQSALLEVMEERAVTVDRVTHLLEEPFQVLATMNPYDHQGTFPLPAAQIDRFAVMLELGYPSSADEVRMLDRHLHAEPALKAVRPVIAREGFLEWQATVPLIHASPDIKRTVVDYVHGLRAAEPGRPGPSPRATLHWVRLAQARALLCGREFVTVEDVLEVAPDVLRHRLWSDGASVRERLRGVAVRVAGTP